MIVFVPCLQPDMLVDAVDRKRDIEQWLASRHVSGPACYASRLSQQRVFIRFLRFLITGGRRSRLKTLGIEESEYVPPVE